jgi:hypothetical protein
MQWTKWEAGNQGGNSIPPSLLVCLLGVRFAVKGVAGVLVVMKKDNIASPVLLAIPVKLYEWRGFCTVK